MYSNKLAIAVKVNGTVLRETGDTVRLPFGSEYSLFIKNLNSVRCLVKIEIDGKDIADGKGFIVPAHGSVDIERFLKGHNMSQGNRFKFIERNAKVEAGRGGIQVEDGLIRIEYEFEREQVPVKDYYSVPTPWYGDPWPYYKRPWYPYMGTGIYYGSGVARGASDELIGSSSGHASNNVSFTATNSGSLGASGESPKWEDNITKSADRSRSRGAKVNYSAEVKADASVFLMNASLNDAGVTAPGSVSNQQFTDGYIGALDGVKHAMVIKLLGEVGAVKVTKPVTVKSKQRCVTCNHLNKSIAKFCSECGTGLEIVA